MQWWDDGRIKDDGLRGVCLVLIASANKALMTISISEVLVAQYASLRIVE